MKLLLYLILLISISFLKHSSFSRILHFHRFSLVFLAVASWFPLLVPIYKCPGTWSWAFLSYLSRSTEMLSIILNFYSSCLALSSMLETHKSIFLFSISIKCIISISKISMCKLNSFNLSNLFLPPSLLSQKMASLCALAHEVFEKYLLYLPFPHSPDSLSPSFVESALNHIICINHRSPEKQSQ